MSQDHPFYEELRERKHRGARWWMVGDVSYYVGLLMVFIAVTCFTFGLGVGIGQSVFGLDHGMFKQGRSWWLFSVAPVPFVAGVVVMFVGWYVKQHAYTLAARDGISADEVDFRRRGGP